MKKWVKALLIVSVVMIVLGGITTAVCIGLANQRGESLDMAIHGWKSTDIEEHYGTPEVQALEIKMGVGEMEIVCGEEYAIVAKGVPESFQSRIENGTWKISQSDEEHWWSVGITRGPRIKVTVPENCRLERVDLDVGVGALSAEQLSAGALVINCGAGDVSYCGQVDGDVDIDCGVGNVEVVLGNDESEFGGTVSCGVGEVCVGSGKYSGLGRDASFGNPDGHRMNLDCGVGSVEVTFRGNPGSDVGTVTGETQHEENTHHTEETEHEEEGGEIHGF